MRFRPETHYYGSACKRCGGTKRFGSNGNCIVCQVAKARVKRLIDPEIFNKRVRAWRHKNKEKVKLTRDINKKAMYARNPNYNKEYYWKNRIKLRAISRIQSSARRKACPKWVDLKQLIKIFEARPEGYHVDHIIPIKAVITDELGTREVCGLTVPWNLQYLPAMENHRKKNKYVVATSN